MGSIEYDMAAQEMIRLAKSQPGFRGNESARDQTALRVTVSYWESMDSIVQRRYESSHRMIQQTET